MARNLALLVGGVPCVVSLHGHRSQELQRAVQKAIEAGKAKLVRDAPTKLPSDVTVGGVVHRWAATHGLPDDITRHIMHAATHRDAPRAPPVSEHRQKWFHRATHNTPSRHAYDEHDVPRRHSRRSSAAHGVRELWDDAEDEAEEAWHDVEHEAGRLRNDAERVYRDDIRPAAHKAWHDVEHDAEEAWDDVEHEADRAWHGAERVYRDDVRPELGRLWRGAKHKAEQLRQLYRDDAAAYHKGTSMPNSELGQLEEYEAQRHGKDRESPVPRRVYDEDGRESLVPVRPYGRALGRRSFAM
jgi:hypothetical protein